MNKKTNKPRQIAQVIFKNAQILDITGPNEVFAQVNDVLAKSHAGKGPAYKLTLVSHKKRPVSMSSGLKLLADESFESFNQHPLDTLLIAGGTGVYQARLEKDLLAFIKTHGQTATRIASICSGTFILRCNR